jgi:hypothetical protein
VVALREHQKTAVKKLRSGKILKGPVGCGKSITALSYYVDGDQYGDLYIITTAKKRDGLEWEKDAIKFGISYDVSTCGKMVVDSWNNIKKYEHVEGCTFIFDEQRLIGSGAWVKSFYKIAKKNSWIILSATPGDTWLDYIPVFVANGFYKNKTEFIDKHVVFKRFVSFPVVDYFRAENLLRQHRDSITVEMDYLSYNKRTENIVNVDYDIEVYKDVIKRRWNIFEDRPIRNAPELFSVIRRVVYSHHSRDVKILELCNLEKKAIVFYNFNYELTSLRSIFSDSEFEIGEWNGHKKTKIPNSDKWVYLVQYTSGSEGWNCVETDTVIFRSLNYSYKLMEQAKGRIDRLNSLFTTLKYYILLSESKIDNAVNEALLNKKNFNEKTCFL